jgi:HAD superfamily phosphoserine phosphatase-like hydrolase
LLSREVGLFEEIGALTDATIKGVIPFRKSFLLRCRLLNEIPISQVQTIIAGVRMNTHLERFIRDRRERCFVVTGNLDAWVRPLVERLGCPFYCSTATVQGDRLIGVSHVLNKGVVLREIQPQFSKIVAIGDGMGDVPMFEVADVRIAFGGTHDPIQTLLQLSNFVTFDEKALCRLLSTL